MVKIVRLVWDMLNFRFPTPKKKVLREKSIRNWPGVQKLHLVWTNIWNLLRGWQM